MRSRRFGVFFKPVLIGASVFVLMGADIEGCSIGDLPELPGEVDVDVDVDVEGQPGSDPKEVDCPEGMVALMVCDDEPKEPKSCDKDGEKGQAPVEPPEEGEGDPEGKDPEGKDLDDKDPEGKDLDDKDLDDKDLDDKGPNDPDKDGPKLPEDEAPKDDVPEDEAPLIPEGDGPEAKPACHFVCVPEDEAAEKGDGDSKDKGSKESKEEKPEQDPEFEPQLEPKES